MSEVLDLLVLGSGVAGLSAAVRAAEVHELTTGVLTKGELEQATTRWAQGGVAAVLGDDPDSTDLHLADTLKAGAGLCDADAVRVLVDEGPGRVNELIAMGAAFDRDETGKLLKAREGGHSTARIVHAGGAATGVEVERALVEAVEATAATILERSYAVDLLVEGGRCVGVSYLDGEGRVREVLAANVLMATGGAGQLYAVTTNPVESTGDGIAMAIRAGAAVADVEFVQFHPTALHHPEMPRPLLSEALRGHGALLRDDNGDRFVDELLPRDEVSRAMTARMQAHGVDHLFLDARHLERFETRFPTIHAELSRLGLDPLTDLLPIAPACHYLCGGVVSDLNGASSLPGLWIAGEVGCNGVHGANRLASNSLLDGMVFGPRVVESIASGENGAQATGAMRSVFGAADGIGGRAVRRADISAVPTTETLDDEAIAARRHEFQLAMTLDAGVLRSAESLPQAQAVAAQTWVDAAQVRTPAGAELANLATVAMALCDAALARTETRGAHTRTDHPDLDPDLRLRLVINGGAT
ncbi:MAG TPA: L-aspartate oxidase [Acidimicrobiales bacterium]|nr:L-aspartate oxidase [Acidimicrobiales bacterium]